tara:strand:+ start:363 stop:1061 length:699 start_codon:yes stop_codon:yes gene_type:complete
MLQEILEDEYLKMFPKGSHIKIMGDYLKYKKNPVVLEFGVERGSSTKAFIWLTKKMNGKVYSIDINDCSNVSNEKNWRFLQSDDLNIDYILEKFSVIKEGGVDLIYIDSFHENYHVVKLLSLYFKYVKKGGAIFIDDIDNISYRKTYMSKKSWAVFWQCIVYDLTSDAIKEFYYNNMEKVYYTKYYGENGLGKFYKRSNLFEEPNPDNKLWNYNNLIKYFYPYLRKLSKIIK